MPNRFIFSLRYANRVFFKLLKIAMGMVFFTTLFRINLYFLSVHFHVENPQFGEVLHSFWMGFRVDAMIVAFLLSPILFILTIQAVCQSWSKFILWSYKIYLALVWTAICAIYFVDFTFFTKQFKRMRAVEYKTFDLADFWNSFSHLPHNNSLIFSAACVLLLALGLVMIKELAFGYWKDEYSPQKGTKQEAVLRLVLPVAFLLFVILSLPETHISDQEALNDMALSPVWCLDK